MSETENKSNFVTIYFAIVFELKKNAQGKFIFSKDVKPIPENYYSNKVQIEENKVYSVEVFGVKVPKEKTKNELKFEFKINEDDYVLSFEKKFKTSNIGFVFDPKLTKKGGLFSSNKDIPQKISSLYKIKFLAFYNGLVKAGNEKDEIIDLIKEGILTFKVQKTIDYFFLLFYHSFNNDCYDLDRLLKLFKENVNGITVPSQITDLNDLFENVNEIYLKKEEIPKKFENLEEIKLPFLAAIIYFFICQNSKNSSKAYDIINELFDDKDKKTILFILLRSYSDLLSKYLVLNENILTEFIANSIKFNLPDLKNSLKYAKNTEIFLHVIDLICDEIFPLLENEKSVLELSLYVKQVKEDEIEKISVNISSIADKQSNKKQIVLEIKSEFWNFYLTNCAYKSIEEVDKLIKLRESLKKYQKSLNYSKKPNKNSKELEKFVNNDKYGEIIHSELKNIIDKNKNLTSIEKLTYFFSKDYYYTDE